MVVLLLLARLPLSVRGAADLVADRHGSESMLWLAQMRPVVPQ